MYIVSSASQSPVRTSIGPPSTISVAAGARSPKNPLQFAMRRTPGPAHMRLQRDQEVVHVDLVPGRARTSGHGAGAVGPQRVLHLHGLEHHQAVPFVHRVAGRHEDLVIEPGSGARHSPAAPPRSSGSSSAAQGEGGLALGPLTSASCVESRTR